MFQSNFQQIIKIQKINNLILNEIFYNSIFREYCIKIIDKIVERKKNIED